jgi:hypothetical protein
LRMTQGESAMGKSNGVKFMGAWLLSDRWKQVIYPLNNPLHVTLPAADILSSSDSSVSQQYWRSGSTAYSKFRLEPWMMLRQSAGGFADMWSDVKIDEEFSKWLEAVCDGCV